VPTLDETLQRRLTAFDRDHLRRVLPPPAEAQRVRLVTALRSFLNFSSNDYLGLASHPAVVDAAARAAHEVGAGAGASRLVCGSLQVMKLETDLASFWSASCLIFSSGYATAR
jgi:7-keto-8-aminopelargonate synthetase-like enzyme